jgi:hypothetical protein
MQTAARKILKTTLPPKLGHRLLMGVWLNFKFRIHDYELQSNNQLMRKREIENRKLIWRFVHNYAAFFGIVMKLFF